MKEAEKQKLEATRREAALTNLYYNRYFMVRYLTSLFLFVNVYWTVMLYTAQSPIYILALPATLAALSCWTMWELALMNTQKQKEAKVTPLLYRVTLGVNVLIVVASLAQQHPLLFPFLTSSTKSLLVVIGLQLVGMLLSLLVLSRLKRIRYRADKQYQRIQTYLKSVS